MPTTLFEEFAPYVAPYAPACPVFVLTEHLAESASRFCRETHCWRVPLASATTTPDEPQYAVAVPAETVLESVIQLELDGRPLSPLMEVLEAPKTTLDDRGPPRGYDIVADTTLQLYPTPDAEYTYRGLVAVKPALDATGVETFIYETWGRAIAYGALSTLKLIPGKSWTDPAMAGVYGTMFDKAVAACKRREFRNTPLRVRAMPFA